MILAYIYPEELPSQKARAISVINSANEIAKLSNCLLFVDDKSDLEKIKSSYNLVDNNLRIEKISKRFLGIKSNRFFARNLLKELKNNNVNIAYVRHLKIAKYIIEKLPKIKVIFECHEIFYKDNPKIKNIEKFVYENSSGLVFINQTLREVFLKEFNIQNIPSKIIHNGTNFNFNFQLKEFNGINKIYYIGNFYKWKGLEFLISGMSNLKNLELNIIGDGDNRFELEKLVEELNLKEYVKFLGFKKTKEIENILLHSKLTIIPNIPSKYSNYSSPIKLYEYMATSNIVIAANMDTIKEIIINEVNGFLFESGDLNSLEKIIKRVLSMSNEQLQEISKNAYETSKNFTWEKRAEQIVSFANGLLNNETA